jgi:hypothetical protein
MSGWDYKKGFSETNLKFTIFKIKPNNKCIRKEKYFVCTSKVKQKSLLCELCFLKKNFFLQ